MFRFLPTLCLLGIMMIHFGCATMGPVQPTGQHRMSRYVPNVSASPAGLPAPVAATPQVSGTQLATPALGDPGTGFQHKLAIGDEVMTSLRGIPNPEDIRNVVDATGHITVPYIGQIHVAGLAASEVARLIEETYINEQIFKNINVIVVSEDKSFFVQGEVNRQGRIRLSGEVTLLKAISEAGGYTPFANRRNVKVIRGDDVLFFNARDIANGREEDPVIQANDIIEVLRSVFM